MARENWYAIYDKKDRLVFVGTTRECSEFIGILPSTFRSRASRFKRYEDVNTKYKIYKMED